MPGTMVILQDLERPSRWRCPDRLVSILGHRWVDAGDYASYHADCKFCGLRLEFRSYSVKTTGTNSGKSITKRW